MAASTQTRWLSWPPAVAVLVGALVAVTLGVVGRVVGPGTAALPSFGFTDAGYFKAWVATVVLALALVQVVTALWLFGRLPGAPAAGPRVALVHRTSGGLAFLLSLPVAFYCMYGFGFAPEPLSGRTLLHSVAGCLFYGAFVSKMLLLRRSGLRGWVLPLAGGLVFTCVVVLWLTSTLWLFDTVGVGF